MMLKRVIRFTSSNRTFMELKYLEQLPARIAEQSSNRTFMELK